MSNDQIKSPVNSDFQNLTNPESIEISENEKFNGSYNILADSRRLYNSQDEFVYLLYNDMLNILNLKNRREIEFSKSVSMRNQIGDESSPENEEVKNQKEINENEEKFDKKDNKDKENWKLNLPDEYVEVELHNKNTYKGCLSRKKMEGSNGMYQWDSGETYKGEFEENLIQGKGHIEWKDHSWYEGDFYKGYRHGIGNFVSHEFGRFYIGKWYMKRKHGTGYCRYNKENNFYEGDWNTDKRHGTGYRTYENGTRYIGEWKNDKIHGIGTMIWPNGDVYRGEWENGIMNGYGEYVWNGFFNKSLSWPQENSYMGEWHNGMRHGRGVLKLNSVGGAKYSGNWQMDKKHGYGMIIGNNGAVTEGNPLFLNNILTPLNADEKYLEKSEFQLDDFNRISCSEIPKERIIHKEPRKTSVFEPLQYPPLSHHIQRLLEPYSVKHLQTVSIDTIASGKCHMCANDSECKCLDDISEKPESRFTKKSKTISEFFDINSSTNSYDEICTDAKKSTIISEIEENYTRSIIKFSEKKYEEHWVHNCIINFMPQLRKIYKLYGELYCSKKNHYPAYLSMGKIGLWQLMRDCGIHKKGISLIQFERYIALNKSAFIISEFDPFERIEFPQFIQALIEISWHLYTKLNDIEIKVIRGRLAGGFYKLMVKDIIPNAGNVIGNVSTIYRDILPLYSVYKLYCDIGKPHTAKEFLRATCILKGVIDPKPLPQPRLETKSIPSYLIKGINAITIGEKLSYIPLDEKLLESHLTDSSRTYEDNLAHELFALRYLGARKMLTIISTVCPCIKDEESNLIINMDYEFTFLEFYEILLEATRTLLYEKKLSIQTVSETSDKIVSEKSSTSDRFPIVNSLKQSKRSSQNILHKMKKKLA